MVCFLTTLWAWILTFGGCCNCDFKIWGPLMTSLHSPMMPEPRPRATASLGQWTWSSWCPPRSQYVVASALVEVRILLSIFPCPVQGQVPCLIFPNPVQGQEQHIRNVVFNDVTAVTYVRFMGCSSPRPRPRGLSIREDQKRHETGKKWVMKPI